MPASSKRRKKERISILKNRGAIRSKGTSTEHRDQLVKKFIYNREKQIAKMSVEEEKRLAAIERRKISVEQKIKNAKNMSQLIDDLWDDFDDTGLAPLYPPVLPVQKKWKIDASRQNMVDDLARMLSGLEM